jgi:ATP-binding cassette, subfamily B, bacterial PglK
VSMITAFRILFSRLPPERRRALLAVLGLMLAGALAEVITIGALFPFLAAVADPQGARAAAFVAPILDLLGLHSPVATVYVLAGLFATAALVAGGLRLLLLWTSTRFVNSAAYDLGVAVYGNELHQPYSHHAGSNSSEMIAAINKVSMAKGEVLKPLMQALIATFISGFLIIALIIVDPLVAIVAAAGFLAIYMAAAAVTRPRLRRNSGVIARAQGERIKALQEGVGGIRDVILDQSQSVFIETFERAEAGYRDAKAKNTVLAGAPAYIVETVSLILIALVVIVVTERTGGLSAAVPVLGVFALGAKRLLPLIQQVYNGWAKSMGSRQVLFDLATLLCRPAPELPLAKTALPFSTALVLDNVGFSYTEDRGPAVSAVSVEIPKGARVGLAGKTGSGKSTLMDLILGLLEPSEGEIRIDGVTLTAANRPAWQKNIAHVPQFIYLSDASIAENIAFGVRRRDIDMAQVRRAAEQAELAEVVAALPQGYETRIGERGIQLSGGQRQRIGIARALYKQASVLVFDEATSALDTETETAVMESVDRLDRSLTILIIAHRLSTLEGCDFVLRLEAGRLAAIETKPEFPRGTRAAG